MNRVVHFEIHADDTERAKKFYADVFGWTAQDMGDKFGNYIILTSGPGMDALDKLPQDPGINGGMIKRNAPMPPVGSSPIGYVCIMGVQDVDAMVAKVKAAGGAEHMAAMDVPNVGRLAYCGDTEGNTFGMLQPVQM